MPTNIPNLGPVDAAVISLRLHPESIEIDASRTPDVRITGLTGPGAAGTARSDAMILVSARANGSQLPREEGTSRRAKRSYFWPVTVLMLILIAMAVIYYRYGMLEGISLDPFAWFRGDCFPGFHQVGDTCYPW